MDQPPIDTHTFNHYFNKPHLADHSETWLKRFPQLHADSLFHGNEKLAQGWGFEITEDRNWVILVCANLAGLLLSAVAAVLSAYLTNNKTVGIAIGTWLTAVQMLILNSLFWHWTN